MSYAFSDNNVWFQRPTAAEIAAGTSQETRAWAPADITAAVSSQVQTELVNYVGGLAAPYAGPLTVAAGAATIDVTGAYRYLNATITATFAITLTSTKAAYTGAYIYVALLNSGAGVTEPTFAAGPTVYYEGSTTFDTTDGVTNVMRIECLDDTAPGTFSYTWLQRTP